MKSKIFLYLTLFFTLCLVNSCSDDEVKPQAEATFTASKTTVDLGEEILFTNNSENATAFKWSFGDGTTSTQISPKKTYTSSGMFTVSLLSTGAGGSTISSMNITVRPDPEIFVMDYSDGLITRFGVSTPEEMTIFKDVNGFAGVGIAYDSIHEKIYFTDFEVTDEGKIWSINLDGTDLTELVTGLVEPYGIALDINAEKVYWADRAQVLRANFDGSNVEPVTTVGGSRFSGVALDPENNKIYSYDYWNENIHVANMDGSNQSVLIPGVWGYAIQIDTRNNKLYFDDQASGDEGELQVANLDGSNIQTIDNTPTRIYGIAVDASKNKLYWTARDTGEVYQSNLDGTHKRTLKSGLTSPRGIFLKK
jgi:PKD repeat protein